MDDNTLANNDATDAADVSTENQAPASKTYTQEEFDRHMAGLKNSLQKKFEKTLAELGDIDEIKAMKRQAEAKKIEEATKRGEFEKVLQDLAAKKDAEIQKRDQVIKEYKVNAPLLNAAAKYKSVNPEQVRRLLQTNVTLNEQGETDVLDDNGNVRYKDDGTAYSVDDLVREFLATNPHFVSPSPSTTNTKSNATGKLADFDLSKLDMKNPAHREKYRQAKLNGLV